LKTKKILVIDDDLLALESMSSFLKEQGYEVFTARNCITGLEIVKNIMPDVIVSDIRMSGLNGIEFAIVVKGLNYCIPLILVSSCDPKSDPFIEKYSYGFLQKPFDINELKIMINRAASGGCLKINELVNC
jgi:two-component SAPR family response regulator